MSLSSAWSTELYIVSKEVKLSKERNGYYASLFLYSFQTFLWILLKVRNQWSK